MSADHDDKLSYGSPHLPDRFLMARILDDLLTFRRGRDTNDQYSGYSRKFLFTVIRDKRWDLIEGAGKLGRLLQAMETSGRSLSDLKETAKWLAYYLSDWGLDESGNLSLDPVRFFVKAEIIEIIRIQYPEEYATIPNSDAGMKLWWRDVGCEIDQSRGYENEATKKLFKNLKTGKIRW